MDFIDIVTGITVILTVPMLVKAVLRLKEVASTRQPPVRGESGAPDKHAEAHSA